MLRAMWVEARLMDGPGEHGGDHVLEVIVGAGHDPAEEVTRSGDRVDLQHLGDRRQVDDEAVDARLDDLQGREGEDGVAQLGRVDLGAEAADDAPGLEAVEAGLGRAPGHARPAGQLEDAQAGLVVEQGEQPPVDGIDPGRHQPSSRAGQGAQPIDRLVGRV